MSADERRLNAHESLGIGGQWLIAQQWSLNANWQNVFRQRIEQRIGNVYDESTVLLRLDISVNTVLRVSRNGS